MPAAPIATSVVPCRHGRPNESVTSTPTSRPVRSRSCARSAAADASGSTGSSTSVPASGVFDWSTPADAQMKPCCVSQMTSGARTRTMRFASRRIHSTRCGSPSLARDLPCELRGLDGVETHDASFDLRDRLLRDDDDVEVRELDALGDECGEVVAFAQLGDPRDREDGEALGDRHVRPVT